MIAVSLRMICSILPRSKPEVKRPRPDPAKGDATPAALGFTVKSGWASAVLLTGSAAGARVADSRRIDLSDPDLEDARQPYHAGFGTARGGGPELSRLVTSVQRFGRASVGALIREHKKAGYRLLGAGIVVGSLIDPDRIANAHIRIHALEGRLFRSVVEDATARSNLASVIWRQRDLPAVAAGRLRQQDLRKALAALGREVEGPWRGEEKDAALAAWLVLAGNPGH